MPLDCFNEVDCALHIARERSDRVSKARRRMTLGRKVEQAIVLIDCQNLRQRMKLKQIAVMEGDLLQFLRLQHIQQIHFTSVAFANQTVDRVSLFQQQSRQMRPGKTRNASDEVS